MVRNAREPTGARRALSVWSCLVASPCVERNRRNASASFGDLAERLDPRRSLFVGGFVCHPRTVGSARLRVPGDSSVRGTEPRRRCVHWDRTALASGHPDAGKVPRGDRGALWQRGHVTLVIGKGANPGTFTYVGLDVPAGSPIFAPASGARTRSPDPQL
jgi:hypothetical protein